MADKPRVVTAQPTNVEVGTTVTDATTYGYRGFYSRELLGKLFGQAALDILDKTRPDVLVPIEAFGVDDADKRILASLEKSPKTDKGLSDDAFVCIGKNQIGKRTKHLERIGVIERREGKRSKWTLARAWIREQKGN